MPQLPFPFVTDLIRGLRALLAPPGRLLPLRVPARRAR